MKLERVESIEQYQQLYDYSIANPDQFWAEQAESLINWDQKWETVSKYDFTQGKIEWFAGAKLNIAVNCIDRHLTDKANEVAIIWEGNEPNQTKKITFQQLYENVCVFANSLKSIGVKKGDTVCIYMPMIPEAVYAMLACMRIGAVHSVVFGGFSPEALANRIDDCKSEVVITADAGARGNKFVPLKANVDKALEYAKTKCKVIVIQDKNQDIDWFADRDYWYHELAAKVDNKCPAESLPAEHPAFILYTSGSTGKPKGIMHTTGGYILYAAITHKHIFDYQPQEVYWCTADIGWITGHSYLVYGPLANGATTLMYEGVPTYPTPARLWEIVDKHKVAIFYTAPTLIRSLMAAGDDHLATTSRSSLRVLGSVGEPINPAAWEWYSEKIGNGKCPIVDTWWQTETGGIMITPLPAIKDIKYKPGAATLPFFGIKPKLIDMETGNKTKEVSSGYLTIATSWPGQSRTIYNDQARFIETYFSQCPGFYFSGDGAYVDADGHYWITGRVDDVINVSGHRITTSEVENVLVSHHKVAEAAVIGAKHEIKGEALHAFVHLLDGEIADEELRKDLVSLVKVKIGSFAVPDNIVWVADLPKTRSGKIMRRLLRKIANKEIDDLGDVSTLAEPGVILSLINKVGD